MLPTRSPILVQFVFNVQNSREGFAVVPGGEGRVKKDCGEQSVSVDGNCSWELPSP